MRPVTPRVSWFAVIVIGIFGGLAVAVIAIAVGDPSHRHQDAPAAVTAPALPGVTLTPVTGWTDDPVQVNSSFRLVLFGGNCYVESRSGDNRLDVSLAPAHGC